MPVHRRLQHRLRASGPVPPHRRRATRKPDAQDHRRRSAPHRHRRRSRSLLPILPGHRYRPLQRHAARHAVGRPLRPGLHPRSTRKDSMRSRTRCANIRRRRPPRFAACRRRTSSRRPVVWRSESDAVALLPGTEPVHRTAPQQCGAHQPAPGDRSDRQTRRRAAVAHRTAQRDGRTRSRRHGEPAVGAPRSRQSRAPRRGRAVVGRRAGARQTRQDRGRNVRRDERGRDQRGVDRVHQPRAVDARCESRARALERAPNSWWCRRPIAIPTRRAYADVLLPATTWGEKEAP